MSASDGSSSADRRSGQRLGAGCRGTCPRCAGYRDHQDVQQTRRASPDYPRAELWVTLVSSIARARSSRRSQTVEWLERTFADGSVLYDIGANVGAYSLVAAAAGGPGSRVIAIEASPFTFASLCANILLNDFTGRITPLQLLLTERAGVRSFVLGSTIAGEASHPGRSWAGVVSIWRPSRSMKPCASSQAAASSSKIDVDGGEGAVLDGAGATLRSSTLKHVLIEVVRSHQSGSCPSAPLRTRDPLQVNASFGAGRSETYNWLYERLDVLPRRKRTPGEADNKERLLPLLGPLADALRETSSEQEERPPTTDMGAAHRRCR